MQAPVKSMQQLWENSYLAADNESYLENLYESYLTNPDTIDPKWRRYFDNLSSQGTSASKDISHTAIRQQFAQLARRSNRVSMQGMDSYQDEQQERVIELINAYRRV